MHLFLPDGYKRQTPKLDAPRDKKQAQIDAQWDVYKLASGTDSAMVYDLGCGGAMKTKSFFEDRQGVFLFDRMEMLKSIPWSEKNVAMIPWNMEEPFDDHVHRFVLRHPPAHRVEQFFVIHASGGREALPYTANRCAYAGRCASAG